MALYTVKLSVQDAAFPLLSRNAGRPALLPSLDTTQTNEPTPTGLASNVSSVFSAVAKPHITYCENVLPRSGGFSSIGYIPVSNTVSIYPVKKASTLLVRNMSNPLLTQEYATVVFFNSGASNNAHTFITATLSGNLTLPAISNPDITLSNTGGIQFMLTQAGSSVVLSELSINNANTALVSSVVYTNVGSVIPPIGISSADFADIKFSCSAGNYLILAKPDGTLYWNNPNIGKYLPVTNATLFTAGSSITGSISTATAVVQAASGTIALGIGDSALGTFVTGDTITGSGTELTVADITGLIIGELITGNTSGATGHYVASTGITSLQLGGTCTGTFSSTETITGADSAVTTTVTAVTTWAPTATLTATAVDAPDYIPSLITGAGFAIPSMLSGTVIGLQTLGDGFVIHTNTGSIFAKYSQNAQYPWVFQTVWNSSPIINAKYNAAPIVTEGGNQIIQFAWTTAGLSSFSLVANAATQFPEISDFIGAELLETLQPPTYAGVPTVISITNADDGSMDVGITRVGTRYLCISYGQYGTHSPAVPYFTQCLVYDIALKRWGKFVVNHSCIVELPTSYSNIEAMHNIGVVAPTGAISCATEEAVYETNGVQHAVVHTGMLIMGGINFVRGNVSTVETVEFNFGNIAGDANAEHLNAYYSSAADAINLVPFTPLILNASAVGSSVYGVHRTAPYHFIKLVGYFHISEFEVRLCKGGTR